MVTSIARQAVILKCLRQKSILVGNYEFYYLAGFMKKLFGMDLSAEMGPLKMIEVILDKLPTLSPKDPLEEYLIKLVSIYEPLESYDDQMKELFVWGETETRPWKV